ncbi:MAG: hypothetical protein J3R72DRAFT_430099 [Linnemannia gamsii]|nr:MAG: hypothetical protein J3R72DRAFT_430099 [Linnemannia gamsii]
MQRVHIFSLLFIFFSLSQRIGSLFLSGFHTLSHCPFPSFPFPSSHLFYLFFSTYLLRYPSRLLHLSPCSHPLHLSLHLLTSIYPREKFKENKEHRKKHQSLYMYHTK